MASFRYRAAAPDGRMRAGVLEAASASDVLAHVRGLGLVPIEASPAPAPKPGAAKLDAASRKALVHVLGELGVLLGAGLTLDRALAVAEETASRPALKAALEGLHARVREGAPLSRAIDDAKGLLPPMASAMAEAGEVNGRLGEALARLAATLERQEALRATVAGAMIYPALLFALAGGVIAMMLLFVVPQFETLFEGGADRLPLSTKVVVGASHALRAYGWAMALGVLGLGLLARAALARPGVRRTMDGVVLQIPRLGAVVRASETARFARVLGSLVEAGVLLPTALGIARRSLSNVHMAEAIDKVGAGLRRGGGLSGPLAAAKVLPPIAVSFLRTGEETAQLGPMLDRLADILERDVRGAVEALIALLTPVITIVMGAAVAGVIASVMSAVLGFNDLALPS